MIRLKHLAAAVALGLAMLAGPPASAQHEVEPETLAAIQELMAKSGMDAAAEQTIAAMLPIARQQFSQLLQGQVQAEIAERYWDKIDSRMRESARDMLDIIAVVYARYFTKDEIDQMTAFYETPVGRKSTEVMPRMMAEITQVMGVYGQRVATDAMTAVIEEMKKDGYIDS